MNSLEELKNSDNISDRKEYVRRINLHIARWEEELPEIERLDDGNTRILSLKKNKEAIKNLKTKLSNYDIYKQKFSCRTCQEVECVCYELKRSDEPVSKEFQPESSGRQITGSNNLETLRGTVRDNSSGSGSVEDLELPF